MARNTWYIHPLQVDARSFRDRHLQEALEALNLIHLLGSADAAEEWIIENVEKQYRYWGRMYTEIVFDLIRD